VSDDEKLSSFEERKVLNQIENDMSQGKLSGIIDVPSGMTSEPPKFLNKINKMSPKGQKKVKQVTDNSLKKLPTIGELINLLQELQNGINKDILRVTLTAAAMEKVLVESNVVTQERLNEIKEEMFQQLMNTANQRENVEVVPAEN
jgi:hypothetical protein